MRLTKSADFALRLVVRLASDKAPHTMLDLSKTLDIPFHNLSKLVQALSKAGVIQTRQGKHGGVHLLKPPEEISLKTVIDVIDGPTRLSECLSKNATCSVSEGCKIKDKFAQIQHQIDTLFDEVKIAEMVHL